ncbi:MAG: hypothetical protein O2793_17000 [Proteobacteria bacterium]|nr:hypothetical protein [Pseudomonadota bacterium]
MLIIAYFVVFFIGIAACFNEAKTAWSSRMSNGLTVFEKRAYTLKAIIAVTLACTGIGGLVQAVIGA